MNNFLISIIHFAQCFFFSRAIYLQKSYICWLDAIRLGFSCETNDTDRNGVNKENTHTKHSKELIWK